MYTVSFTINTNTNHLQIQTQITQTTSQLNHYTVHTQVNKTNQLKISVTTHNNNTHSP